MCLTAFRCITRCLRRQIGADRFRSTKKFTAEEHQIARRQIAGVLISSVMLAGVQGMPLVGAVLAIANLFFFEDDEIDAETALRTHISEFAYKGPLTWATGTDVASRMGLSNLLFRNNRITRGRLQKSDYVQLV